MAELKKCPFCGSDDIKVGYFHVWCANCGAGTTEEMSTEEAIKVWNNRVTEADIRAKVIDEFAEKLNAKIEEVYSAPERESEYNHAWKTVCRIIQGNMEVIAEQLKGE